MKLTTPRRLGALVAVGMLGALLPMTLPAADAATGNTTYTCALPLGNSTPIVVKTDTTAPAAVKPNVAFQPTLQLTVTFPAGFVQGLRNNGFTTLQGTAGTAGVTTNDAATTVSNVKFPQTNLPASGGITVLATAAMAQLTPTEEGSIVYKTGALAFTLKANAQNISASCPLPGAPVVIDTVTVSNSAVTPPPGVVKASSTISTGVKYVKRTDKLTVAGKVTAKPTQAVAGKVKFVLYKKGKKVRSVTKTIGKANTAKTTFTGKIKKGTYVLVATYQGSSKVKSATTTRTIKIKR